MNLKDYLLDDDRGVSPVIGVILMVAITVILAAVIATFVMNMGPPEATMPNAQFTFDEQGSDEVIIEHNGGGAVDPANIEIQYDGGPIDGTDGDAFDQESDVTAGAETGALTHDGDIVQIVWQNPNSDESQIMAEWEP